MKLQLAEIDMYNNTENLGLNHGDEDNIDEMASENEPGFTWFPTPIYYPYT